MLTTSYSRADKHNSSSLAGDCFLFFCCILKMRVAQRDDASWWHVRSLFFFFSETLSAMIRQESQCVMPQNWYCLSLTQIANFIRSITQRVTSNLSMWEAFITSFSSVLSLCLSYFHCPQTSWEMMNQFSLSVPSVLSLFIFTLIVRPKTVTVSDTLLCPCSLQNLLSPPSYHLSICLPCTLLSSRRCQYKVMTGAVYHKDFEGWWIHLPCVSHLSSPPLCRWCWQSVKGRRSCTLWRSWRRTSWSRMMMSSAPWWRSECWRWPESHHS